MTARPDVTTIVTTFGKGISCDDKQLMPRTWGQQVFDDSKAAYNWICETVNPRLVPAEGLAQLGPVFWMDVQWALFITEGEIR